MPVDLDAQIFPMNAVVLIAARMGMLDTRFTVVKRPLRRSDPNLSIGIYSENWMPNLESFEMLGQDHSRHPTLEQYTIIIEAFVKHQDEQTGLAYHAVIAETIRTTLALDAPLRTQLGGLQATLNGTTKELERWWVRSGRYLNNKLDGNNLFLSTTDLMLEVATL